MASPDAEDQGTGGRTDNPMNEPVFWLSSLPVPACFSLTPDMAEWADSTSRSMTWTERRPDRFFKEAAGAESSSDEFGILEDDRCIDTGAFQELYLLHELMFACSQPLPRQPQSASPS